MRDWKLYLDDILEAAKRIEKYTKRLTLEKAKKDTLVVELGGDEIHEWFKKINKWLVDNDYPESDFPTYKPHISLTEEAGIKKPEWKKEYEKKIKFRIHVVGDRNHEEIIRLKSE